MSVDYKVLTHSTKVCFIHRVYNGHANRR